MRMLDVITHTQTTSNQRDATVLTLAMTSLHLLAFEHLARETAEDCFVSMVT